MNKIRQIQIKSHNDYDLVLVLKLSFQNFTKTLNIFVTKNALFYRSELNCKPIFTILKNIYY